MPRPARGTVEIVKRKDGLRTFWVRLTIDGRRNRVRLGTDRDGWTPARAQVELEEQIKAVRAGAWTRPEPPAATDDSDPTFRMFASSWLEDNMLEWRPSTIADIKWRLESHLLPHVGEDRLSTFDIPRVTAVKTTLLKESRRIAERLEAGVVERDAHNMPLRPLSNESINKCMALLSRILDDAVERGYLRDNPSRRVRRLRHHRPRRPVLEPHEVRAMFEAANRLDRRATGVTDKVLEVAELRRQGVPYKEIAARLSISISTAHYRQSRYEQAGDPIPFVRVWVRLLCAAGLRIDEACRTRRRDVDLIANCLRVGHAKTPAGVRTVQLTPDTLADLERYLDMTSERPASGLLLPTSNGTPYNRTSAATSIIKPLVAQTNVVLAERSQPALRDGVTAHALRKTYFTFLHEAGAPPRWVADQGGHSDPSTSLRIYTESLRGRERGHHGQAFDALLNGTGASVEHPSVVDDAEGAGNERR
ncbi:MAG: tyrosine-type recombinase/integrase [Thermoleophilia bacterium]